MTGLLACTVLVRIILAAALINLFSGIGSSRAADEVSELDPAPVAAAALPADVPEPDPAPVAEAARPADVVAAQPVASPLEIGIDITAATPYSFVVRSVTSPPQLIVDLPHAYPGDDTLPPPLTVTGDFVLRALRWGRVGSEGTRLVLDLAYAVPNWRDTGWVEDGTGLYRLSLRAERQFVVQQEFPVAPGVKFIQQRRGELYGPVVANILSVQLADPATQLAVALARDGVLGLETVSSMAQRHGAVAAINGTFFHSTGLPLGLVADQGLLVSGPVYNRTALLVLADGSAGIDRVGMRAHVELPDGSRLHVNGINRTRKAGETVVYNERYGKATPRSGPVFEVLIRDGVVAGFGQGGTTLLPGLTVVAGEPGGPLQKCQVGAPCLFRWELSLYGYQATVPGEQVWLALAGGPRLVAGGQVQITAAEESFRADVTQGRAPRTALGIAADGTLLLVTVNGRKPDISVGMSLEELAALLVELGAIEGMNLDGGGSTTMVVRDRVVNMPSGGAERAVGTALLVFPPS